MPNTVPYRRTYYAINDNAGAYVDIPCTMSCRKMVITECRKSDGTSPALQGLRAKFLQDDGTYPTTPEYQNPGAIITIVHPSMAGAGAAPLIGHGVQGAAPAAYNGATTYATGDTVTSGGATYYSLVDANVGHAPAGSPTYWATFNNVTYKAATVPVKLLSDSATATQVLVEEYS